MGDEKKCNGLVVPGQVNLPLHKSTPLTALSLYSCSFESGCTNEMMNDDYGLQSNHNEPVCHDET